MEVGQSMDAVPGSSIFKLSGPGGGWGWEAALLSFHLGGLLLLLGSGFPAQGRVNTCD